MLNSCIISSSFWIWLMMHPVEEVSPQLQSIQVSTGPGLLAAGTLFSLTRAYPLYFEKKKKTRRRGKKDKEKQPVGRVV